MIGNPIMSAAASRIIAISSTFGIDTIRAEFARPDSRLAGRYPSGEISSAAQRSGGYFLSKADAIARNLNGTRRACTIRPACTK
jgi:hypothetical protein